MFALSPVAQAIDVSPDGGDSSGCVPPPADLVSWWGADRDATDLEGDNIGTLKNGVTYVQGLSGAAFSFDGVDDVVQVGDTPGLKMTTATTIEGWIYPTGLGQTLEGIIANREGEYEIARASDGTIQWAFANTDPGWTWVDTGNLVPQNSWTHVAVTYDNGPITTYANGVQVHQYPGAGTIGDTEPTFNDFRVGNRQAFPDPFKGRIDELKVYNRALSASEMQRFTLPVQAETASR